MNKPIKYLRSLLICLLLFLLLLPGQNSIWAADEKKSARVTPEQYGVGIVYGYAYDPRDYINFAQLNAFMLHDYDKVWGHAAPDSLRFKMECNLGTTINSPQRAIASFNTMSLYYLKTLSTRSLRPYVEAGIGIIYTGFQVDNQGLRINFNPQFGIGTEILVNSKPAAYISIRGHHFSNGGLHKDNRGMNSVVVVVGQLF